MENSDLKRVLVTGGNSGFGYALWKYSSYKKTVAMSYCVAEVEK